MRKLFAIVAVLAIALACYSWIRYMYPPAPYMQDDAPLGASEEWHDLARKFDSEKSSVASIFDESTEVQSFRITVIDSEDPVDTKMLTAKAKEFNKEIGGYPVIAVGPVLKNEFSSRLGKVLLDPRSYLYPGQDGKSCIFMPGVAFRVWKDKAYVDVVICFSCNQLFVREQDHNVPLRSIGNTRARFRVGGDFDPVRSQLVELCKQVFVQDKEIQVLSLQ